METFGARLHRAVAERGPLCVGIDPHAALLRRWGLADDVAGLERFAFTVVEALADRVAVLKPQSAFFERFGSRGVAVLESIIRQSREAGAVVLLDVKRGDIGSTVRAYAAAYLDPTSPIRADAITASPYLGVDTLETFVAEARPAGAGVFVLVRTSNPGAADLEDLELADGGPLWGRVAAIVDRLGAGAPGAAGLHDVGAVVGATAPEHIGRLRELMPHTPFLLPGIGAQGGRVEDVAPAFAPGRAGGLVTASRSIVAAYETAGGAPPDAARAEAERLREAAWSLA
jgi:orotidine-5'-phosphate decarboxylase